MRFVIIAMGGLFLIAALYVVTMNWGCVIASSRNKARGIDRHHSTVPVVSFLLAFLALFMWPYWPQKWVLLVPALDIANLSLLFWPFVLIYQAIRKRSSLPKDQR